MKTIWLDTTAMLNWQRPTVGILRVEFECAKYGLAHRDRLNIRFCRFDPLSGYQTVVPDEIRQALERVEHHAHSDAPQAAQGYNGAPANVRSARRGMRGVWHSIFGNIPKSARDYISDRRDALRAASNSLREMRRAVELWHAPESGEQTDLMAAENTPFENGDAYISIGLDWDHKNQTFLTEIKQRKQLRILRICYDIIPVKFPHLCIENVSIKFARYFADLAWCADEVLCISECSRRDLFDLLTDLGAPIPPMTLITLGSNLAQTPGDRVTEETKNSAGSRFILFVSTIERRKNHETLYRAYTRLVDQGEADLPKLIFVGMVGWGVRDFLEDLRLDPRTRHLIKLLSNVSDADLAWLYKNALFTVFPSIYEGWGLGVAESLANGKFCISSNGGALPEVGQDLVEYIDPWDVLKWAERMNWYFKHPEDLRKAEARVEANYVAAKWDDLANTVFQKARALDASKERTIESGQEALAKVL